ncbi:MAG: hypothetical protein E6I87_13140 [Chloroflexi bacterium]|nr:MAG: hypothetical protein E6I87_13140 [Chloroflexota bacterium]
MSDHPGIADKCGQLRNDGLGRRRLGELGQRDPGEALYHRRDLAIAGDERYEPLADPGGEIEPNRTDLEEAVGQRIEAGGLDVERYEVDVDCAF